MLTDFDISNIDNIMAYPKQYDWFNAKLLRLMADADLDNLAKLATVYPDVFYEFCRWKWHAVPYRFFDIQPLYNLVEFRRINGPNPLVWGYPMHSDGD